MKNATLLGLGVSLMMLWACKNDTQKAAETTDDPATETPVATAPTEATTYSKTMEMQNTTFNIAVAGEELTVAVFRGESPGGSLTTPIVGKVTGTGMEDLDADGSPEVVIFTQEPENAMKGHAYGFSSGKENTFESIYIPPLSSDPAHTEGYVGGDEFALVETSLVRRMVLNDGSVRQLQYKLVSSSEGKSFEVDRVVEY
ncbi:hypothetical protein [Robertkochia sediminum]|uniref:hypothetical protein n=1 Tax=Robertkochia sediminum TaxID=2785326 RepID=UPI0019326157|nr:hypothetical protein [Robertkochia sediminum]MBL7472265.1 hypothetical protein [Robertkochia sediminum]